MAEKKRVLNRTQQILISVLLGLLSFGSYSYVIFSYYNSINSHITEIVESAFTATRNEISNWTHIKKNTLELLNKGMQIFEGTAFDIQTFIKAPYQEDKDFLDIFFGTSTPPGAGGFAVYASDWTIPEDYDWTRRSWYTQASSEGRLIITEPYKDLQTGNTIITISKPLVKNAVFQGVLAADINTESILNIIKTMYISEGTLVDLVDSEGNYIDVNPNALNKKENIFDKPSFKSWKKEILSGDFFIHTDILKNRYYASIKLQELNWIILTDGDLSSYADLRGTVIRFTAILLLLLVLFLLMLSRTWRTNTQLQKASKDIEENNINLEKTVNDRTASLRNILDNAEEGFFTFSENLQVDPNFSKGCEDIFGKNIQGLSVPDLLFPGNTQTISDFRQGFELYFAGKSKAEIIFDLTEKQASIQGKTIQIAYKETVNQRILCILRDITLEIEMSEKNRKEAETQKRILQAIHNKHFFAHYLASADNLFANLEVFTQQTPNEEEETSLLHNLHTFKGDSGFFGFIETQAITHDSETLITDSKLLNTLISYREILIQIRKAYYKELKTISETLGDRWLDESLGILIPREDYLKLIAYVQKYLPEDKKIRVYLNSFRKIPLAELFSRLQFAAAMAAEKLGKKIKPMSIIGGNQRIIPDPYIPLVESCIHIVNNMVDHGIEYPYERQALQKPAEGSLELIITQDQSMIVLEFKDDGKGINPREIERLAKEKNLIPPNKTLQSSEAFALLLSDGFSTRKELTTTSGRGIGLGAVQEEVKKLKGTLEIKSKLGKGTSFEIIIPLARYN